MLTAALALADAGEAPAPPPQVAAAPAITPKAPARTAPTSETDTPALPIPDSHFYAVSLGFSHWFGETVGAPEGYTTPAITLGARPLRWLELRARYSLAIAPINVPGGVPTRIGFASLEVLLEHQLLKGAQRINLAAGPSGSLVHGNRAVGPGIGAVLMARWLFQAGISGDLAIGPFFEARSMFYTLPNDTRRFFIDPRRDAQIDLGVAMTFNRL